MSQRLWILVASLFCTASLCLITTNVFAQSAATGSSTFRTNDFLNSLGVCAHIGGGSGPVTDLPSVAKELSYIGISRIRADLGLGASKGSKISQLMQLAGTRFDLINGSDPTDPVTWQKQQIWMEQNAAYIDSIEGNNEVDIQKLTYNGTYAIDIDAAEPIQTALYTMVKGDTALKTIPVLNFSTGSPAATGQVGNISAYADYGNVHAYSHYNPPYTKLPQNIAGTIDTPGRPIIMTETGQTTVLYNQDYKSTNAGVSESTQAKYVMDEILDNFKQGVVKTYIYELLDEIDDPQNTTIEDHFGLFHFDESPKLSATALHNLHSILNDAGSQASTFAPSGLSYTLSESTSAATMDAKNFHLLLQKQNGTFELVLWAEPPLQAAAGRPLPTPVPNNLMVLLNRRANTINIYDPLQGTTSLQHYQNTLQIPVVVTDHPVVVEITL